MNTENTKEVETNDATASELKRYMDGMHSMSNVELALTSFDRNAKKYPLTKIREITKEYTLLKSQSTYIDGF